MFNITAHYTETLSTCVVTSEEALACDTQPDRCVTDINSERTQTTCCCSTDKCNANSAPTGLSAVPIPHNPNNTLSCIIKGHTSDDSGMSVVGSSCNAERWCRTITYVAFNGSGYGVF
jgi:hypothetical protein